MTNETLSRALDLIDEIVLAGMSGTGMESDEAMTEFHARQAWKFISIAARAKEQLRIAIDAEQANGRSALNEVARIISVSSTSIGNLPELPGYNGSILCIDDTEANRVSKELECALQLLSSFTLRPSEEEALREIANAFEAKTAPEQYLMDMARSAISVSPAQPAREWVGLTEDEVIEIGNETHRAMPDDADDQQELLAIYQIIESELREKNAGQPVASEPSSGERTQVIADLKRASKEIADAGHNGWGNTCMQAAALLSSDAKPASEQHPDDKAVDFFAQTMRAKMKKQREKGYGGWESCPTERLQKMLVEHIAKGDPVDVANFAMMLYCRGDSTAGPACEPVAVPQGFVGEVAGLRCPNAYGFEGADTFPDCGHCVVCQAKAILSAAPATPPDVS